MALDADGPIRAIRRTPAREAQFADFPDDLNPKLRAVLTRRGIERLYSHQAEACQRTAAGSNAVIVTPTASGKTLCYNLPVLNHLLTEPGARAMYLFANGKDTLFRIHGTNQPEYIGQAISSGCIRLTNEDVIDLYSRVKLGSPVVVLAPGQGDSPYNPRVALSATGGSGPNFDFR